MKSKQSCRKYIHPRNKYKNAPDFKELAILYPEFQKFTTTTLCGHVKLNFQNPNALRALTQVLLKHDFGLYTEIPDDKLVPTLTLRMNYVLWIEDLLHYASLNDLKSVQGIDIGTGAICIYPLLLAKLFGCSMLATEIDKKSIESSIKTIERNNLQNLIHVKEVSKDTIIKDALEEGKEYDFTMCNPPFFDFDEKEGRVEKLLPPRNAPTGSQKELTTYGGEGLFVSKMVEDSLILKDRIKIYTTMLGHKMNLIHLIRLIKRRNITNYTWTEFNQGHTTRWGVAWTFIPENILNLSGAPVIRKLGDNISHILRVEPYEIIFPTTDEISSIEIVAEHFKEWCKEFNIQMTKINYADNFDGIVFRLEINKVFNRKRRRMKRSMQQEKSQINVDKEIDIDTESLDNGFSTKRLRLETPEESDLLTETTSQELLRAETNFSGIFKRNDLNETKNIKMPRETLEDSDLLTETTSQELLRTETNPSGIFEKNDSNDTENIKITKEISEISDLLTETTSQELLITEEANPFDISERNGINDTENVKLTKETSEHSECKVEKQLNTQIDIIDINVRKNVNSNNIEKTVDTPKILECDIQPGTSQEQLDTKINSTIEANGISDTNINNECKIQYPRVPEISNSTLYMIPREEVEAEINSEFCDSNNTDLKDETNCSTSAETTKQPELSFDVYISLEKDKESERNNIKISMMFEDGSGGKLALASFRQFVINKLQVKQYQIPKSTHNQKRRNRLKKKVNNQSVDLN